MTCPICKSAELEITQQVLFRRFTVCRKCVNYIIYTLDDDEGVDENQYLLIPVKEIHPVEELHTKVFDWSS